MGRVDVFVIERDRASGCIQHVPHNIEQARDRARLSSLAGDMDISACVSRGRGSGVSFNVSGSPLRLAVDHPRFRSE